MQWMTTIVRLLFCRSPAAVFGRVWTIVVNAVDGMMGRWAHAHVGNEIRETFPSITNRYAASAISFVRTVCGYAASATHCFPNFVFGCVGFAVCKPVFPSEFGSETSARTRVAVSQGATGKETFSSAIAAAKPTFSCIFAIGNDGQATKAFPDEIVEGSYHYG